MGQADTAQNTRSRGGVIGLQGRRRQLQIAREDEAKRQRLVAELLAELGRPAGAVDRVSAETLAATVVRADRLRMAGRSDIEERRLVVQLQRALGLKPQPAGPQKAAPQSLQDWWQTASAGEGGER
jgi:hypothetical protein